MVKAAARAHMDVQVLCRPGPALSADWPHFSTETTLRREDTVFLPGGTVRLALGPGLWMIRPRGCERGRTDLATHLP